MIYPAGYDMMIGYYVFLYCNHNTHTHIYNKSIRMTSQIPIKNLDVIDNI